MRVVPAEEASRLPVARSTARSVNREPADVWSVALNDPSSGVWTRKPRPVARAGERPAQCRARRVRPRIGDVLREQVESRLIRVEAGVDDLPRQLFDAEAALVQDAVVLGEVLTGIELVVLALVAGEELTRLRALADVLVGRPPLRPPVDRRPWVVRPAVREVMAVLVRDDRPRRDRAQVLAERDDRHRTWAVAAERACAADLMDAIERRQVQRQLRELGAVEQRAEQVGEPLRGRRIGGEQLVLDEDRHRLAVGRDDGPAGETGQTLAGAQDDLRRLCARTECVRRVRRSGRTGGRQRGDGGGEKDERTTHVTSTARENGRRVKR